MTRSFLPGGLVAFLLSSSLWALPSPPHDFASGITCADCHVPYGGLSGATLSTATGGNTTTLLDSSMTWTVDAWAGGVITFTSGASAGQYRSIDSNTATSLQWSTPLPAAVGVGDSYEISLATQSDVAAKCVTCHNPTGTAALFSDVGVHKISKTAILGCGKCHEPHNIDANSGQGQFLIRDNLRHSSGGVTAYPSGNPLNRLIVGAAPYNGVCENCHSRTAHHRNNSSGGHSHNNTQLCTNCHTHTAGFTAPDCTTCHNVAQDNGDGTPIGGRRAIVAEFPVGPNAAHAHFDGIALNKYQCRVCHDTSQHQQGQVRLIDADDGSIYTFVYPGDLSVSPDVSDFCLSCHDADGAQRLATPMDPFGGGNAPPDTASKFSGSLQWNEWYGDNCFGSEGTLRPVNSHHDISDADQTFSGARIECLSCHGSHSVSQAFAVVDPFNKANLWTGTDNGFCLSCHNGGTGPAAPGFPSGVTAPSVALRGIDSCSYTAAPWNVDYRWSLAAHGGDSKRPWTGYSGAPGAEIGCRDCHDQHGSYTATNTAGNPYMITDAVTGSAYVDDGVRPGAAWTGPPWTTMGVNRAVVVPVSGVTVGWGGSQGLCSACHAGWLAAYSWHATCAGCQTCHGHGANWGNHDWGPAPNDSTWCP